MDNSILITLVSLGVVVLFLLGVPIFLVIGLWVTGVSLAIDFTLANIGVTLFEGLNFFGLLSLPLFILTGDLIAAAGIARRLAEFAHACLSWMRGGLGLATIGAGAAFGAVCGSGPASAATMTAVAMPEMRRHHFNIDFGAGIIAAGGSLGIMVPPSVVFIVYAIMTELSPATLFIAGIIPSLMVTLLFGLYIFLICRKRPDLAPLGRSFTWKERFRSLTGITETLILFTVVMGGMFTGWFTPTEAAAVGAGGSILIAMAQKKLTVKVLWQSLMETVRTSCMVLIIVAGALVFGRFLAVTNLPTFLASGLAELPVPSWVTMAIILFFYMVSGCFVDALALVLLTIPIFYPIVITLGYDPVWFGIMVVMLVQMGVLTPPVGVNVYVVSGIERTIPMQNIFRHALPFAGLLVIACVIMMLFPDLALVLPRALGR